MTTNSDYSSDFSGTVFPSIIREWPDSDTCSCQALIIFLRLSYPLTTCGCGESQNPFRRWWCLTHVARSCWALRLNKIVVSRSRLEPEMSGTLLLARWCV
jgi:hypothetical protein